MNEISSREFIIDEKQSGERLDKVLSGVLEDVSRSLVQKHIKQGDVYVNDRLCQNLRAKLVFGDQVRISLPESKSGIKAQDIALDVFHEDEDVLIINKPAGMTVHPGAGQKQDTLVNALVARYGEEFEQIGEQGRPGIVHRLDKHTSGLMMVARSEKAYKSLTRQLSRHEVCREYHAILWGVPDLLSGEISQPLLYPKGGRRRVVTHPDGRPARTRYRVLKTCDNALSLCQFTLETGRTHQIRVHSAYMNHPVLGDNLYGIQKTKAQSLISRSEMSSDLESRLLSFPRQALHAISLGFLHPRSGESLEFKTGYPADMKEIFECLF